jgi:hypothetical protein
MRMQLAITATLAAGLSASASTIDTVSAASGGTTTGLGTHDITIAGGTWGVKAHAYDSDGTQGVDDPVGGGAKTGVYTPLGSAQAGTVTDTGTYLTASALAQITWNSKQWSSNQDLTSTGLGPSFATVASVGTETYAGSEVANSKAAVHDPRSFSITFAAGERPEIDFVLTISAGTQLTSLGGTGLTSSSSITGDTMSGLFAADLFDFSWSADSAHPNSSIFTFSSNPILGLNDALIGNQFLSDITDAAGVHTLTSDFTITGAYFPVLPAGSNTVNFTLGGDTYYNADAAVTGTPEPATFFLTGLALSAIILSFAGRGTRLAQLELADDHFPSQHREVLRTRSHENLRAAAY